MRTAGVLGMAGLVCCMAVLSPAVRSDDSAVARALLESGKKSLSAKKCDDAVAMFKKAMVEDPALLEAAYWIAAAQEKCGNDAAALLAYRQFLAQMEQKAGNASPEEQKLRPLAEKRVESLSTWEREYLKVEDKNLGGLLQFAQERMESCPWVAMKALDIVLAARPKHPAAIALKERMTGAPDAKGPPETFPEVSAWRDLVADKTLLPVPDQLTYTDAGFTLDVKGSLFKFPRKPIDFGPSYAVEIEFRVTETYEDKWALGVAFGATPAAIADVSLGRAGVTFRSGPRGAAGRELGILSVPLKELSQWHRIGVGVRGNQVQVFLDGKKAFEKQAPDRDDLAGEMGLCLSNCKAEVRVLRGGKR